MKVYIVGIGIGSKAYLTEKATKIVEESDLIIGANRMLETFNYLDTKKVNSYLSEEIKAILDETNVENVSILVSGDVGFFSATKRIIKALEGYNVELIPGISSIVYFSAKVEINWDNMKIISAHGRDVNIVGSVMKYPRVFVLTGGKNKVSNLLNQLSKSGIEDLNIYIGENLSYENEKITNGTVEELLNYEFDDLSVMIVENPNPRSYESVKFGIDDSEFVRGEVPMTKSEIRAIALSKLKLKESDIVYDIGSGTGSVAIEAALLADEGTVYAIEKNPKAIKLININREKFRAYNIEVIEGTAPDDLENLPAPDKVFIGGTGNQMEEIIETCIKKNPNVRMVVNAIAVETISKTIECFKKFNIKHTEIVQMNVSKSKKVGSYNMMMAHNPVYIFSGDAGVDEQ